MEDISIASLQDSTVTIGGSVNSAFDNLWGGQGYVIHVGGDVAHFTARNVTPSLVQINGNVGTFTVQSLGLSSGTLEFGGDVTHFSVSAGDVHVDQLSIAGSVDMFSVSGDSPAYPRLVWRRSAPRRGRDLLRVGDVTGSGPPISIYKTSGGITIGGNLSRDLEVNGFCGPISIGYGPYVPAPGSLAGNLHIFGPAGDIDIAADIAPAGAIRVDYYARTASSSAVTLT